MHVGQAGDLVLGKMHDFESIEKLLTGAPLQEVSLPRIQYPPGLVFFRAIAPLRYAFALRHRLGELYGNAARISSRAAVVSQSLAGFNDVTFHDHLGSFKNVFS